MIEKLVWEETQLLRSRSYVCGHCAMFVSSEKGWYARCVTRAHKPVGAFVYLCHNCLRPTFIGPLGEQIPAPPKGNSVGAIDDPCTASLYDEARKANAIGLTCSVILLCSKIIRRIGEQENGENLALGECLKKLESAGVLPARLVRPFSDNEGKMTLDVLLERRNTNEAQKLLALCELLLKVTYEFRAIESEGVTSESVSDALNGDCDE